MKHEEGHVLVIGAASTDTTGHASYALEAGSSTPGEILVSVGGVGRNVAENLARMGEYVILLSAVGDDDAGRQILRQAADCGIDVSHVRVHPDYRTAAYLAILDRGGNPVLSIDDMNINRELLTPDFIYRRRALFRDARMLVLDANLSPRALDLIFRLAGRYRIPVCADPTTATLAPRLSAHLPHLTLITPNGAEAEALCGVKVGDRESGLVAAQRLLGMGVEIVIVTLGATGLVYVTSEESGHIPAIECELIGLTGAGDALTAAVVFGLLNNLPIDESVRLGTSAAALTLQCRETVCPTLSLERLYEKLVI
jgi:pseudouridine kinase